MAKFKIGDIISPWKHPDCFQYHIYEVYDHIMGDGFKRPRIVKYKLKPIGQPQFTTKFGDLSTTFARTIVENSFGLATDMGRILYEQGESNVD